MLFIGDALKDAWLAIYPQLMFIAVFLGAWALAQPLLSNNDEQRQLVSLGLAILCSAVIGVIPFIRDASYEPEKRPLIIIALVIVFTMPIAWVLLMGQGGSEPLIVPNASTKQTPSPAVQPKRTKREQQAHDKSMKLLSTWAKERVERKNRENEAKKNADNAAKQIESPEQEN